MTDQKSKIEDMSKLKTLPIDPENVDDEALEILRRSNLGRLLDEVHLGFDKLAMTYLHEAGYPNVTAAHSHVLRTMRSEGATITQMADHAGISKQAMSKLVTVFEKDGYVEWRQVEGTSTKLVHTTEAGRKLLVVGINVLSQVEQDYFGVLDADERELLREMLLRAASAAAEQKPERLTLWRRRRA